MKLLEVIGHNKTETLIEIYEGRITHIVNEESGANFWYFLLDPDDLPMLLEEVKETQDTHEKRSEE